MTRRKRLLWLLPLSLCLALATGAFLSITRYDATPIKLIPLDCDALHADGRCELRDPQDPMTAHTLRLWMDLPGNPRSIFFGDLWPLHVEHVHPVEGGGRLAVIDVPASTKRITVLALTEGRIRRASLQVSPPIAPEWLKGARRLYQSNQLDQAFALLSRSHADIPRDRALAAHLLALIHLERGQFAEAERLLRQALAEDRATDLPSRELEDAIDLSSLLGQSLRRFVEAENILQEREALFEQVPLRKGLRSLQLGLFRHMRGDHAGAMRFVDEGMSAAARFEEHLVGIELRKLKAEILAAEGQIKEALATLDNVERSTVDALPPCRKANLLNERGSLRLFALEVFGDRAPANRDSDPRPLFKQALEVRAACDDKTSIASDWTGLASAGLLFERIDEAENDLRNARAAVTSADASLRLAWTDIEGQIQLARRDWSAAEKTYRALLRIIETDQSPDDPYGSRWRAWIGLGQALEAARPDEAIAAYRRAEAYLDARGVEQPLNAGRGGFLGRYEHGTTLFIDFLHRSGKRAEALAALRHARIRALLTYRNLARIASWTDAQRQASQEKLAEYTKVRHQLEQLEEERSDLDDAGRAARAEPARQLRVKLQVLASEALGLGSNPASDELAPPAKGEVLIACHPARSGWLCFAQSDASIESIALPRLDAAAGGAMMDEFSPLLDGAVRVRVLAFGESRRFDFAAMPFHGHPLGEALDVQQAADLVGAARSVPAATPDALVMIDPDSDIPESGRVQRAISPRLMARFSAHIVRGFVDGIAQRRSLDDAHWLERLIAADLFFYLGHNRPDAAGGPMLQVDKVGLSTSDILTLKRVPPWVVLVACGGGFAEEETGGLERVGVAQAFLLRGSHWVIAPVREVETTVGAELALALVEAGIDRPGANPVHALREAQKLVRERLAARFVEKRSVLSDSLDAFRVFVL